MKSCANAFGGTTARACDGCVKRRARWYCAADDAFLCHACDGSVHSANPLARRHERVLLKSVSFSGGKYRSTTSRSSLSPPRVASAAWHHGFTRKARTPRGGGSNKKNHCPVFHDPVPEISADDLTAQNYDEDLALTYQVPVFLPVESERRKNDAVETKPEFHSPERIKNSDENNDDAESCLNGFFPTDMELAEFAADMETLLCHGLETESSLAMEELGLASGSPGSINKRSSLRPKVEQNESREENDRENVNVFVKGENDAKESVIKKEKKKVLMLNLNYEAVLSTWGGQGSPWTDGEPPEFGLNDDNLWPVNMDNHQNPYVIGYCGGRLRAESGREARVSRYREKRRTRLFSKKIRYEVRRLNAEKRPRMKGRFVKRSSPAAALAASSSIFPMIATS